MRRKHLIVLTVAITAYLYLFFQSQFFLAVNHAHLTFDSSNPVEPMSDEEQKVLRKLKFIQLSDLHGSNSSFSSGDGGLTALSDEILSIVKSEKPDFVFITGDFVECGLEEYAYTVATRFLRNLTALMDEIHQLDDSSTSSIKQRVYGVIGNHDHKHKDTDVRVPVMPEIKPHYPFNEEERKKRIMSVIEKEGHVKILENEYVYIEELDLLIIGFGDPFTFEHVSFRPEVVRESLQKEKFVKHEQAENKSLRRDRPFAVVLSHNPDTAACFIHNAESYHIDISETVERVPMMKKRIQFMNEIEKKHMCDGIPADLILSGHTHGGQLSTPSGSSLIRLVYETLDRFFPHFTKQFEYIVYFTIRHWNWLRGLHEYIDMEGNKQYLYVNSGIHTSKYLRLWTPPEVSIFSVEY